MDKQMNDFAELHLQSVQEGTHVCLPLTLWNVCNMSNYKLLSHYEHFNLCKGL